MIITLQNLKDLIEEIESSLPENQTLKDIPLQHNRTDDYNDLKIEIYNNLGFIFATIEIT